jgi:hypothetical protein
MRMRVLGLGGKKKSRTHVFTVEHKHHTSLLLMLSDFFFAWQLCHLHILQLPHVKE